MQRQFATSVSPNRAGCFRLFHVRHVLEHRRTVRALIRLPTLWWDRHQLITSGSSGRHQPDSETSTEVWRRYRNDVLKPNAFRGRAHLDNTSTHWQNTRTWSHQVPVLDLLADAATAATPPSQYTYDDPSPASSSRGKGTAAAASGRPSKTFGFEVSGHASSSRAAARGRSSGGQRKRDHHSSSSHRYHGSNSTGSNGSNCCLIL